jgi:N-acetylmuramoyl-L-alanine amidase
MASSIIEAAGPGVVRFSAHRLSSPSFGATLRLAATVLLLASLSFAANTQLHKQEARLQFEKAEQAREALNGRPEADRTRRDYQRVADAYRRVYYLDPASSKADASVMAVAELLASMGRQFQPGEKDLHSAIGEYEFLRREYPGSKYRVEALFTIGQIYKDDLGDTEAARATFQEFLRRYPHDQRVRQAKDALAELNQPKESKEQPKEARVDKPEKSPAPAAGAAEVTPTASVKKAGLQLVTGIRHWSSPDSMRVAIDVDGPVEYQTGRVPNPDRIFFDLPNTKLASTLVGKSFDVQDGFLKKIRVAQYQRDSTRVVLEVQDVSDFSAFLLPNPYRLIIDVHGRQTAPPAQVATKTTSEPAKERASIAQPEETNSRSIVSGNITNARGDLGSSGAKPSAATDSRARGQSASSQSVLGSVGSQTKPVPKKRVVEPEDTEANASTVPERQASGKQSSDAKSSSAKSVEASSSKSDDKDTLLTPPEAGREATKRAETQPTSAPTVVAVAPREKSGKKATKAAVAQESPGHEAAPTSAGDRSLIRALGLKIGRIVIDAGHGGHDTGTIGPDGLMEKELVLDVSLRLGRLLETRLGADVIYTRDDDTFIPLETRTAIANEQQADLFVSIHANSSPDPSARGVETYYLNFTSNADALEVAARENAVSEKSIHELQDLVKKITLKEKIDESRELASDVQQSLYSGLSAKNPGIRNRGVKKAPFVVLIGANMPSILAEISFVSNTTDEEKLQTPEYRQKIAESLYRGIAKYAGGLSGVKVASKLGKQSGE